MYDDDNKLQTLMICKIIAQTQQPEISHLFIVSISMYGIMVVFLFVFSTSGFEP